MAGNAPGRKAEFKSIGGQTQLVAKKNALSKSGSLPSLNATGGSRGSGAASPGLIQNAPSFKQRGIMSEVVRAHQDDEVDACRLGPIDDTLAKKLRKSASAGGFALSKKMREKSDSARPITPVDSFKVVLPKVVEVYRHGPGDRPRKVTVERRKKWYESLNIEELLLERGISFESIGWDKDHWLVIENFENSEYDIRSPEQWIAGGIQADGSMLPVTATGLRLKEGGGGLWQECQVISFQSETRLFQVQWMDGEATPVSGEVSKLRLLIHGEGPGVFADKIQFAFLALKRVQSRARLNFFIDNMPTDDIQCLDVDQISRVLDLAKNMSALREAAIEPAANDLVREVNLDFARTMNKIILTHQPQFHGPTEEKDELEDMGAQKATGVLAMYDEIDIDELEEEGENHFQQAVPWFALWPVVEYDFTQTFSSFCFSSLFIKPEVVSTLCAVSQECIQLMAKSVYNTRFTKLMRLEQFKAMQKLAVTSNAKIVRETWTTTIQKLVLTNFKNVGKGWFSIYETNPDTYRQER